MIRHFIHTTRIGPFRLGMEDHRLVSLDFPPFEEVSGPADGFGAVLEQLDAYVDGQLKRFNLPLEPRGTPFQQRVWQALLTIPWGETRSYLEVAHAVGNPKGVRAVAQAIGKNPIGVIIPCHRVIGKDGSLTGFGGGLPMKATLLRLEGVLPAE